MLPFTVCSTRKNQAEWTETRTGATPRRPAAPDTGTPAPSSHRGGRPAASPTTAPLPGGGGVTRGIRAPAHGRSVFRSQFLLQFLVFILCLVLVRALMPVYIVEPERFCAEVVPFTVSRRLLPWSYLYGLRLGVPEVWFNSLSPGKELIWSWNPRT